MPKSFLIDRNSTAITSFPFAAKRADIVNKKYLFSGGVVLSLKNDRARIPGSLLQTETDDQEFFLQVKTRPLSAEGEKINIIGETQLAAERVSSDDLLNMYIPVGRTDGLHFYGEPTFNSNFYYIRPGSEFKMSGFFDFGRVHLSGFVVFSTSREIIRIFKNQEFSMNEGDVLFINFAGKIIHNSEFNYDDFYLSNLSMSVGSSSEASFRGDTYTYTSDDSTRSKTEYSVSCAYPIGMVLEGNFYTFARGNVEFLVGEFSRTYFLNKVNDGTGCISANYETKVNVFLSPHFI